MSVIPSVKDPIPEFLKYLKLERERERRERERGERERERWAFPTGINEQKG